MKGKRKFLGDPRGSKTMGLSNLSIAQPSITVKPNKYLTANGNQITSKAYYGLATGRIKNIKLFNTDPKVDKILKKAGYNNVRDHNVTSQGVAHIKKQHGVNGKHLYGYRPINSNDIRLIPDIISNPNYVGISSRLSKAGKTVVEYRKTYGSETYYYFEYLHNGGLYTQTFYVN